MPRAALGPLSTSKDDELTLTEPPGKTMAKCEVCGNDYDKSFTVTMGDASHTFDSFECAIHALAPECAHCGCRIIGHGMESDGTYYCCANCAAMAGVSGLDDRV